MSPLRSRGPLPKGTEMKVAHKRAELLRHRAFLGVPKQGDIVKVGPQVGVTPTFSGVPEKGFKSGLHRAPGKNPIVGVLKGGP